MLTRGHIGIIGAGLAGAACARALARTGFTVSLLEAADGPAAGASGNPIGILHSLISKDHNLASQWVEIGMQTTVRWVDELQGLADSEGIGVLAGRCGVLQMNADCSQLIHWDPGGAWIKPARFVQACLADAQAHGAQLMYRMTVEEISAQGVVTVREPGRKTRQLAFDAVVVCTAMEMGRLLADAQLMLNAIRGTVTSYAIARSQSLPCVICADGYATPVVEGEMVVGASYERLSLEADDFFHDEDPDAMGVQTSNLERLAVISESLGQACAGLLPKDRSSVRCATLDRMPHVGRVLDSSVALAASISQIHQMPRSDRRWVLGGLGSRGLSSAALGAEVIAAQLRGQPTPLSARLLAAVDPVRFALRRHQRRKIG